MRETELAKHSKLSLEQLYEKIQKGEVKELNVIVKGDVQGSVEAVSESLRKLSTDAIRLNVMHASVGAITETDVNLATASNAIILGFNVRPEVKAQAHAEKEGVDIRLYNIIYDAVDDIKKAMEGLLEPTLKEKSWDGQKSAKYSRFRNMAMLPVAMFWTERCCAMPRFASSRQYGHLRG